MLISDRSSDLFSSDLDILILATGSRAFVPNDVPIKMLGNFTMRDRGDADNLRKYLQDTKLPPEEQHVVIVGGGLLGLELAAALKKKNINISKNGRASSRERVGQ